MISTNQLLGLEGKTAVVTGAGGVICSRIAEGLCEVGMNVMLLDIDEVRAIEKATQLKEKFPDVIVEGFFANVLDKRSLESAKKRILTFVNAIDFLINGAGGNSAREKGLDAEFIEEYEQLSTSVDVSRRLLHLLSSTYRVEGTDLAISKNILKAIDNIEESISLQDQRLKELKKMIG